MQTAHTLMRKKKETFIFIFLKQIRSLRNIKVKTNDPQQLKSPKNQMIFHQKSIRLPALIYFFLIYFQRTRIRTHQPTPAIDTEENGQGSRASKSRV